MFPMHITTIPRPISRILFALIASYAFCPCRTSWNVLVLKTCKGSTPMLQMTSCIVLQWTLFFFHKGNCGHNYLCSNHSTHCTSEGHHSASSPPPLAGAGEVQRAWDTIYFVPHLGSPWCPNLHQMSADTISRTLVVNARDPCDQLHSQCWSKNFCSQGVADFMVRQR